MKSPACHLDQRFAALRGAFAGQRPPKGSIRAVRDALGMTSAQFARRLRVAQPTAIELERSEAESRITLQSLERAAEALGCRLVYALVPEKPLEETLRQRAKHIAAKKIASVEHTMRLEDQAVRSKKARSEWEQKLVEELLAKPARLWDEP